MTGPLFDRRQWLAGTAAVAAVPANAATRGRLPAWSDFRPYLGDETEAAWLQAQVPLFDCPDASFLDIYYFRWRSFRRSLKLTPEGWVVWEFPYIVAWAGLYNCISDAAPHHIYEGRWLRDRRYMDDYIAYWLSNEKAPLRGYSAWLADAVWAQHCVSPSPKCLAERLQPLVHNYHQWEDCFRQPNSLYTQVAVNDGMEECASGPQGLRPTLNSYQYGDARAIAAMARTLDAGAFADAYDRRAAELKTAVQTQLWNPKTRFFDTVRIDTHALSGVRELLGYIPWYFNLPDAEFAVAWAQLTDPQGFKSDYGPTTLERRCPDFQVTDDDSLWNGSSWPYATSQTLVGLANLLNSGQTSPLSKADYFDTLRTYTRSQYRTRNGKTEPWIGESLQPFKGNWTSETEGYNHSTYADLIITGLLGLRPRADDMVEINPLLPEGTWDHFALTGIAYHGHTLDILYDKTGTKYGAGSGLSLRIDGKTVARRKDLGRLTAPLPASPQTAVAMGPLRDEIGPGPMVQRVTATASFWRGVNCAVSAIDGFETGTFWSSYESGLDTDWFQITFPQAVTLKDLNWSGYEDEKKHKAPAACAVEWWDGTAWQPVATPVQTPPVATTRENRIRFTPVKTDRIRLLLKAQKPGRRGIGVGLSELRWTTA